jgi:hypothetical protein
MDIEQSTLEKCLICVLIIVVLMFLFKKMRRSNRERESFYSQNKNIMDHRVRVRCGDDDELGLRVDNFEMADGEESLDSRSTKSSGSSRSTKSSGSSRSTKSSGSTRSSGSSRSTVSRIDMNNVTNVIRDEKDLCVVDKMDDEVYKFATQEKCDCNKQNGCSVCELKHSNDFDVTKKLCQKRKTKFACLVDRMESDNDDYMKGLMLGTNIY